MTRKRAFFVSAAAVAAIAVVWTWRVQADNSGKPESQAAPAGLRTAKVSSGVLERTIRVTGTTAASQFASITVPMMRSREGGRAMVLLYLAKSGAMVRKGEMVAQLDGQTLKDEIDDIHAQVIQADSDIRKRKAEQAIDWENLQQTLRQAKAELDKAKLDASATEIRTKVDQEILKLAVEEAEAHDKQLRQDLTTKQESFRAEIRILELTKERQARHRDRHKVDLERFTMHAPIDGLAVITSFWRSGEMAQFQQGDQLYPGQTFMKIVNTSTMQMEGTISQVGSDELRLGQPARVHFDAFPDLKMEAKVYALGAIATGGWRQNYYLRTVPVRLKIIGADPRVIPDLSTSADIVVDRRDRALRLPAEALESRGGKFFVQVRDSGRIVEREVKVGLQTGLFAEVLEGLQAGDEVVLGGPAAVKQVASR